MHAAIYNGVKYSLISSVANSIVYIFSSNYYFDINIFSKILYIINKLEKFNINKKLPTNAIYKYIYDSLDLYTFK